MRIKVCCGCLSGFVHGIVDAVHLRLSFLLFSFGRLDFAASTLSFLCGLLLHVEVAAVASTFSGSWKGGVSCCYYFRLPCHDGFMRANHLSGLSVVLHFCERYAQ